MRFRIAVGAGVVLVAAGTLPVADYARTVRTADADAARLRSLEERSNTDLALVPEVEAERERQSEAKRARAGRILSESPPSSGLVSTLVAPLTTKYQPRPDTPISWA